MNNFPPLPTAGSARRLALATLNEITESTRNMDAFRIDAPAMQDLDAILALVALAQHRPVGEVNRGIYEMLCAGRGEIEMPIPQAPTTNTGRVARDKQGRVIGFLYAAFPVNHLMPMLMANGGVDLFTMAREIVEFNVLAVSPQAQGQGVGTALVDDAMARARQAGLKVAWVTAPDAAATGFWSKRGATIGRKALRIEGVGKVALDPAWHAQGVLPVSEDCEVVQRGGTIACRWGRRSRGY